MKLETLASCPACGGDAFDEVFPYNDLRYLVRAADPEFSRSDFALCFGCGLTFAARRQLVDDFAEYYTRFAEWENRTYAVYPPPAAFIRGKTGAAVEIARVLVEEQLLRSVATVLHVRCDGGALMALLRDDHGIDNVYGLDVFETNRRFARQHYGLKNVEPLLFGDFVIPFAPIRFDLIISNHLLTHAARPRQAFAALRDRLSPNGALFLYNEQDHMLGFTNGASFLHDGINNFHKQLFTEQTLLTTLRLFGAEGKVVGHRNGGPLVVARAAPPLTSSELPPIDYAPYLMAFRSWAEAHERRWRRNFGRRIRQRYRLVDQLVKVARQIERRVRGRAPVP